MVLLRENPAYLTRQIITYIGNKRTLLPFIGRALRQVKRELGKERLRTFDVFSGSGVVARYLKKYSEVLYANDLEAYSRVINKCYLSNASELDLDDLTETFDCLQKSIAANLHSGFISELYSPADNENIYPGERVFFTRENAMYIDTARQLIDSLPENKRIYYLAPLLYNVSVHSNTGGVFKGFYKNRAGIGQFGGEGRNALERILGRIQLEMPIFSRFDSDCRILQADALSAIDQAEEVDFAYLDPPYNQHPYGSNYFMLNLVLSYQRPEQISNVSGIPNDWNRSPYNVKKQARNELFKLVENIKAKYVLISYNSEGFVKYDEFVEFLSSLGKLHIFKMAYNTFRACRNLQKRDIHVKEYLFLLKK